MVDVTWKDIRSLRLRVLPPDGRLAVSAPHHVPLETVRQFLDANREWTARHSQRVRMNAPVVLPLVDGGRVSLDAVDGELVLDVQAEPEKLLPAVVEE